ncbi:MAG: SIS domain-containing protein [Actinomycetes bacterium]
MPSQMALEIREQPAALQATRDALRPLHDDLRSLARATDRVVLYARGSSDSAATYGRYLLEVAASVPASMGAPSMATLYDAELDLSTTLAVICSQSGHTGELVEVAEWARRRGARIVSVTNDERSPIAQAADVAMVTRAGVEVAVPATKSHSTCLLALAELAVAVAPRSRPRRAALLEALDRVPEEAERLLAEAAAAEELAGTLVSSTAMCVVGRGFTFTTAQELALKIEETTSIPCLGMSQADLQHGPVAVLGPDRPLIVAAAPDGPTLPGLAAVAKAAHDRGAAVIVLGGGASLSSGAVGVLAGPRLPEEVAPIALIVPGQLLAEALSRATGHDPDHPPGLSKVTQTA